ncbi:putative permease, DMT superfamily [Rubidibacter lacunae KORDI 51-2]|uniref:Putative permease, DMT superfamily n=1 Tax=Rubidibacter lacunae KORDI 51-2 TaxID=582515 RepID=U5DR02_9CHRO|nr:DMT family transporter [Rubidibacter lacunae]ERN43049.1 putative permease, DMT superfamily [Rubidibacter lacunae KORDI 51-2]
MTFLLVSALLLAVQNIIVRVVFQPSPVFGRVLGGWLSPSPVNSLLFLQLRALLTFGVMLVVLPRLYPPVLREAIALARESALLWRVFACGSAFFLTAALLYFAIAQLPAGIAIALLFVHPVLTVLLAWILWGDRPTRARVLAMVLVCCGLVFTIPNRGVALPTGTVWGAIAALVAGGSVALYTIGAQRCLQRVRPIPFSLIVVATILVWSSLSLLWVPEAIAHLNSKVWVAGLLSAAVTCGGQICLNAGIYRVGAPTAALIGAVEPGLTALLAWWIVRETLPPQQAIGIGLVAIGVVALSLNRQADRSVAFESKEN